MKAFKKLFFVLGVATAITIPSTLAAQKVNIVYAVEEPPIVETTTTEVPPVEESTTTEEQPPIVDTTTEVPPVVDTENEPTEPEVVPFEKQTYVRKSDETHYEVLELETQERFTITYYNGEAKTVAKGTYTLDGNNILLVADAEYVDILRNNKLVLANNGTFQVYMPQIGDDDFTFNEVADYLFKQAWFYMPFFLTIVLPFLISGIVKICGILSNAKTSVRANKKVAGKVNEVADLSTHLSAYMNGCVEDDLVYLKSLRETMVNKKQIAIIDQRIAILEERKNAIGKFAPVIQLKAEELNSKLLKQEAKEEKKADKVKVRVKIVDGE